MSSSSSPSPSQNPRNWRFTWEAQSHIPTVRLYLFNPSINPSAQCADLKVDLIIEQSSVLVTFIQAEAEAETSLRVPLPSVLVDPDSPVHFRAHDDHIEVKLVLLLPVDHPLVSEFDSPSDEFRPLSVDPDLKKLSAVEEVYFLCRSCSTKLTRPLRLFKEMPSVNWQEVADNWFGDCCCSFGGISEKLVVAYAKSYTCTAGVCLLDTMSVILCKDDLVRFEFIGQNADQNNELKLNIADDTFPTLAPPATAIKQGQRGYIEKGFVGGHDVEGEELHLCSDEDNLNVKLKHEVTENVTDSDNLSCMSSESQVAENSKTLPELCTDVKNEFGNCDTGCCTLKVSEVSLKEQNSGVGIELLEHQKILLNGFLWNGFMARSSNISKDVKWVELLCPQCSCLLGAYPCFDGDFPLDGGVRLFKCHISTCLPAVESNDLFRRYSLESMFANQLLESAKDELSFRTVVRDMQTSHPMLQLVLLNPDSWCYTGSCLYSRESAARINMYPAIKVLFSACSNDGEIGSREAEEWTIKNEVDEVYMLPSQIGEVITSLESANGAYPPSRMSLQDLRLSSMRR